jgi:hypothetical protein
MSRISNVDARRYITNRKPFKTNSGAVHCKTTDDLYVVYSYGDHYPMWVYDCISGQWFGNSDQSSKTTQKQKSQTRPSVDDITMVTTDYLQAMILAGSYANACARRIISEEVNIQ